MPIIKISYAHKTWPSIRQTPKCLGNWDDFTFVFNQDINECDAWVVIGDLLHQRERTKCPPNRTLLINEEPPTMRSYPEKYLSQFSVVATCGNFNFKHPCVKEIFPLQPWYIGINQRALHAPHKKNAIRFTYDDLKVLKPPRKTKLLSVIYSDKKFTEGHVKRHKFVNMLKTCFGDSLDIFGRGFHFVDDKWDAIADYEYHLVIENSCYPHYWTEKLADSFLGWSYPIYYGCPNVTDYFDSRSLTTIDIESPKDAINIIENILYVRPWQEKLHFLRESRERILDEYNLFPMIIRLLKNLPPPRNKEKIELKSISATIGNLRSFARKTRSRLQFGLGITRMFPFLRKI